MARWAELYAIARAIKDLREAEAENERLRDEIAKLRAINAEQAERIRRDQQTIRQLRARDDARFARHSTRSGE